MTRAALAVAVLALAPTVIAPAAEQTRVQPPCTVIEFNRKLDQLTVPRALFGVFRDVSQSPQQQFISESFVPRTLPGGREMGFLQLAYLLEASDTYNGFWLKTRDAADRNKLADWSDYRNGSLVLRLGQGKACTDVFRLEIKTQNDKGVLNVYPSYVRLDPPQLKAIREKGYAAVVLPLRDIVGGEEPLTRVSELVLVFERDRVTARRGVLLISSIRLISGTELPSGTGPMLDELASRAFAYFQNNRHPQTGLVRDRAGNFEGQGTQNSSMASIAATGYYLAILPEAVRLKWITPDHAREETDRILRFAERLDHKDGLLFHFIDWETGKRWKDSEVSTLDSAIFFNGAMVAAEAFPDLAKVANGLLDRVQWSKFLTKKDGKVLLSMGWSPERGLLGPLDVRTSEAAMALFVAIGAKNPIDERCWYNTSAKAREIAGYRVLHGHLPLFVSYYGLGFADLKGLVDKEGVDLYDNAVKAALANREFCRTMASRRYATYEEAAGGWWGISAGDSAVGYVAPGPIPGDADGTVWPTTALATVPWIPEQIEKDLEKWQASQTWPHVLGKYGLAPFNHKPPWIGKDVIGIDLGAFLVNLANYRNRTAWDLWMRHPVARAAIDRIGFVRK